MSSRKLKISRLYCQLAQNRPKSQILLDKTGSQRDLNYIMTLYTGMCICKKKAAMMGNMKWHYLMENLFSPENLYKIAGVIHKEIHGIIDEVDKKFFASG